MSGGRRRGLLVLAAAFLALAAPGGLTPGGADARDEAPALALVEATVFPEPGAVRVPDAVVLVRAGRIEAVGPRARVAIPEGAEVLDCAGLSLAAGFWNSHVHLMSWRVTLDAFLPQALAGGELEALSTRRGFVHVLDTGSWLTSTARLRRRIEACSLVGPEIRMAAGSFVAPGGSPFYLTLRLPELASPAEARAALEGGVDILAHAFPGDGRPWDRSLPSRMAEAGMALVPTLSLWPYDLKRFGAPADLLERIMAAANEQVAAFSAVGGQVLFGTDVGYVRDFDPTREYELLAEAGLSFAQILASLTTAPAERFGAASRTGRVAEGLDADLVVFEGDPERDIAALARVRMALRRGEIVHREESP